MSERKMRGARRTMAMASWARGGLTVSVLVALAGCAKKTVISEPPAPAFRAPAEYVPARRPVTEAISFGPVEAGDGAVLLNSQRLSAPAAAPEGVSATMLPRPEGELVRVQMSMKAADFGDVLRVLLGEHLGRNYVIDPKVTGAVTLEIDDEFTKGEILELVGQLGLVYGWILEDRGDVLFVRGADRMVKSDLGVVLQGAPALPGDAPAVRVRRLRYVGADQISTLLKELISEQAKVLVVGRTVVLADTTKQIARLSSLITALDSPVFDGVEIWTYRLGHRKPEEAQRVMEQLATGAGLNAGSEANVAFVPVVGTQRLMVVAKDATLQPMVQELLRQVDQPSDVQVRQRYVYRVQHYPLAALVKLVQDFFAEKVEATAGAAPLAGAGTGDSGSKIRLVSDPQSDLILIHATPADYAELLATLRMVDRPVQQVAVQSIIAEVRLTNNLEYGVEYFLSGKSSLGSLELTGTAPLVNPALATGGAFFIGGDGFAVIQALDRESEARVLSQPKLVMSDREKGSIQVGGEVPTIRATQGAATQQGGSSDIRTEIEYRDTGVILDIEPQVSETGVVTLKISQEVRDALPSEVANTPEFTTRKIETSVIIPSGHTVLLGGIIIDDDRRDADRIPILGRVPVAGELFSNKSKSNRRTELVLAITPTILSEPQELLTFTNEFMQSVGAVRAALLSREEDLPRGALHGMDAAGAENVEPERPELAPESGVEGAPES